MTPDPAFEHIHEPGGFRRNYVLLQGAVGEETEQPRILNNFIDFLYLFGHFVSGPLHLGVLLTSTRREKTSKRLKRKTRNSCPMKPNDYWASPLDPRTRPRCKRIQKPHRTLWHGSCNKRSSQSRPSPRRPHSSRALRRFSARA